jgi:predicted SAM-dependent methyltransferase
MGSLHKRISFKRNIISYARFRKIIGAVLRNKSIQKRFLAKKQYLNVGCGVNLHNEFINLDYDWRPGVLCWDFTKRLPFSDGTFEGVIAEHCLEHISREVCEKVLCELRRILRPNGTLRISVPDAELYLDLYVQAKKQDVIFPYPEKDWIPIDYINLVFSGCGHLFAYDSKALARALKRAGFESTTKVSFMQGRDKRLLVDSEEREPESLYVEAVA